MSYSLINEAIQHPVDDEIQGLSEEVRETVEWKRSEDSRNHAPTTSPYCLSLNVGERRHANTSQVQPQDDKITSSWGTRTLGAASASSGGQHLAMQRPEETSSGK